MVLKAWAIIDRRGREVCRAETEVQAWLDLLLLNARHVDGWGFMRVVIWFRRSGVRAVERREEGREVG